LSWIADALGKALSMDTDDKSPSLWLRLCGTVVGAVLSAIGATVLFFLGALLSGGGGNWMLFVGGMGVAGACSGFLLPRQTLESLCVFLPGSGE